MNLRKLTSSIFFTLLFLSTHAQAPKFESYKVINNLSNVQVNAIVQDLDGFIWLGTNYGLVKYDGVDFRLYTVDDSLYSNEISSLCADKLTQTLWIGHSDGKISYRRGNNILKFKPEEGLSSKEISSLFVDSQGVLWFTTFEEGIYYYTGTNRKRLYNLNTDDGLLSNYVYSMVQVNDSMYYFATDIGISVFNAFQNKFVDEITSQDGLPDNLVKDLIINDSMLWIGMYDGGICKYNLNTKQFSGIADWDFGSLCGMVLSEKGEIFGCTERKGVVRIQYDNLGNSWYSNFTNKNGLIDNKTKTIFSDREGNIWVGTRTGLSLIKHNNIEFFDSNSGFGIEDIFSLTLDHTGQFWLATQNGLYTHYRNKMGVVSTQRVLNTTAYDWTIFISVYTDVNGFIWAGTYGYGVFKIDPITLKYKHFSTTNGIASNDVFYITGDSSNIWLASVGGGVSRISLAQNTNIKNFTIENGLPSNYIYSIYIEKTNKIWLSTDGGGATIIENDIPRKYDDAFIDSLNNKIFAIIPDQNGKLWFNVADKGLVRSGKKNIHLNIMNALSTNSIQSAICNNNNQLVVASNLGIDLVNIKSLQCDKFGEESGVKGLGPNLNAIYKDSLGSVYIGTKKGIVKINGHLSDTLVKPMLLITNKRLFLNEIPADKTVFNYKENNISFNYTALWYKSPTSLVYRYKLEGYDLDWSTETYTRAITYPKLPHGNYKFIVQVKLSNGSWMGTQQGKFTFTIKPPIWKTTWFIIMSIILGIFAIYGFINYRIRKLKKDKEILEQEVVKRTAKIRQQKEEIEAQRDEIEAQRNYVMEQRDKIEAQNKDITASIQYASRIQRAVLPPQENFEELLGSYFIFFMPRDIVSGDFYYLNKKANKIIVAAADCTGHGVPGAFMSLLGVSLLNQIVSQLADDYNAASLLDALRFEIKKALRQTGKKDEAKDGMDISLCVIDKPNMKLDYAGAFNPLLIVRNGETVVYKANKMPIGVYVSDDEQFTNHSIMLEANDTLYIYSDGFQDQFGGVDRRKYLPKRLRNFLFEISNLSMQEQQHALSEEFITWKGDESQIDDILVMGIRI